MKILLIQSDRSTRKSDKCNGKETENKEEEKSSNANLSNLGIKPHDFTGFRYGTTSYEVAVPEETESVEIYATAQDSKATITGTGKKTLEKGENKVQVVVTAENGTTKIYTINIIREIRQEGEDKQEEAKGLAQLKIENITLSPFFQTDIYEYTAKYMGEENKLNMQATPTDESYLVEIIGNENLQEGENTITLLVSEANGSNIATYQITLDKSLAVEENKEDNKTIVGIVIAGIIVIAIVVGIIIKIKSNKKIEREFSGVGFYNLKNQEEEEEEEEIPKALRKEKTQEVEEWEPTRKRRNRYYEEENEEYEIEQMSKEKAKEKFLDNYSNYEEEYEIKNKETRKKDKHKGKRFK